MVGKPIVDDQVNVYIATEEAMRKFSPDGRLLWTWMVPDYHSFEKAIPNNAAIMDGAVYNCLTSGDAFALSMETGDLLWMSRVSLRGIGTDTAFTVARDGVVLLDVHAPLPPSTHNKVLALNGTNGVVLWDYQPAVGVWNFMPLFPGDGTILFQSWTGGAQRVNLTDGSLIWRVGPEHSETFTDGGAALGPNGMLYTVSSEARIESASSSRGGGLHAYNVSDGKLVWARRDFSEGIYTWPVVGRLGEGVGLSVVTGVGSLGGIAVPLKADLIFNELGSLGMSASLLFWCICSRRRCRRESYCGCLSVLGLHLLAGILMPAAVAIGYSLACRRTFLNSVQAFDAETGQRQWSVDLPPWHSYSPAGDHEGLSVRRERGTRSVCLPPASSYPTLDARGVLYIGHMDGRLYRIKDWDGDGRIEGESELCSFEAGSAFFTGGPTIVPGLLLASSCDTLYVFEDT